MTLFEGKTSTERNKIIAAIVLGVVALFALFMAFGPSFGGSTTTVAVTKVSPTPKAAVLTDQNRADVVLPTVDEQRFQYETTPVVYNASNAYAPDPGRNIFAFYEPPPPTPYIPPTPKPFVVVPPSPTPTPVFVMGYSTPQNVFAGTKGFRLEIHGDRFTPDAKIYFNQVELPTQFVGPQRVISEIPASMIVQAGPRQIIVQTPDGRAYSDQFIFNVQAPPTPTNFQYIGMIGRKRYNNDTAYFMETGKPTPFGARLNDIVGGRFRLIDISATEVVFEDTTLAFKHRVAITAASNAGRGEGIVPFNPGTIPQIGIPGIPNNIPRNMPANKPADKREDVDDNDGPKL